MSLTGTDVLDLYTHANRLTMNLARRVDDALAGAAAPDERPITRGEAEVLLMLARADAPLRPQDVSDALDRSSPTISHVLTSLEQRGLITRDRYEGDGRGRTLTLTPSGGAAVVILERALANATPKRAGIGPQVLTKVRAAATAAR